MSSDNEELLSNFSTQSYSVEGGVMVLIFFIAVLRTRPGLE